MDILKVKSLHRYIKETLPNLKFERIHVGSLEGFTPPSFLVGEYNYPKVSVGVMFSTENNSQILSMPNLWVQNNYTVSKIFSLRRELVNARSRFNVYEPESEKLQQMQLASMSSTEVKVGMEISKVYDYYFKSKEIGIYGKSADMEKFSFKDDVKIDRQVEKVYYDKDLKASDGIITLYSSNIQENKISDILSLGAMGVRRKIVPTKWSITAVDDTIGRKLISDVKQFEEGDTYAIKSGGILGNHFTFLFIKGEWSFELIEVWNNSSKLFIGDGDYELYEGRKTYASNTAGGYYAVRLAVLEELKRLKRQFTVVAIREITPDYFVPLGVWVVRESARAALKGDLTPFKDLHSLIDGANSSTLYLKDIPNRSRLLKLIMSQRRLFEFA
ncbi:MAG: hypothetical protein OH316_01150 [Candidatus Parvarchaeota archaeon]|nr:hypothetical protein [Candidatus Parvarchaeota archaeon]MCW1301728.1 hypothetical protein [Candidatus Parvarchaeota archaeon]